MNAPSEKPRRRDRGKAGCPGVVATYQFRSPQVSHGLQAVQRLAEEPLRCRGIARRREVEVDCIAELVDGSIEVGPLAADFDVGLLRGQTARASRKGPRAIAARVRGYLRRLRRTKLCRMEADHSTLRIAQPATPLRDLGWRVVYRVAFPVACCWWWLRRARHEGALVAVYVGSALLLLQSSYRSAWNFPGGSVRPGERPEDAARRELAEETGIVAGELVAAGTVCGTWEGQRDRVHVFELRLPPGLLLLHLDNREIISARLAAPAALRGMKLTGPVAAYLGVRLAARAGV